jgi:hypothetical protein
MDETDNQSSSQSSDESGEHFEDEVDNDAMLTEDMDTLRSGASSDEEPKPTRPHRSKASKQKSKEHRQLQPVLVEVMEKILQVVRDGDGDTKARANVKKRRVRKSAVDEDVQAMKKTEPAAIRSVLLVSVALLLRT